MPRVASGEEEDNVSEATATIAPAHLPLPSVATTMADVVARPATITITLTIVIPTALTCVVVTPATSPPRTTIAMAVIIAIIVTATQMGVGAVIPTLTVVTIETGREAMGATTQAAPTTAIITILTTTVIREEDQSTVETAALKFEEEQGEGIDESANETWVQAHTYSTHR